jgi:hypothetical protein
MSGYGRQIVLTASVAVIVALGMGLGIYYAQPYLNDRGSAFSSSSTTTVSSGVTSTQQSNTTSSSISVSLTTTFSGSTQCVSMQNGSTKIYLQAGSSLNLCVDFYYYSYGNPVTFNSTDQIKIEENYTGYQFIDPRFVVNADPSTFSIGGNSSQNEGIVVAYHIQAPSGSNGTYILDLGWQLPQKQNCYVEYQLIVGSGLPDYTNIISHCETMSETGTGSSPFPLPSNILFAEVVNSP